MDSTQLVTAFTATLEASLHGLQALEPLLEREREALTGRDPQRLEALVRDKLAVLEQLEHSVRARDGLQRAAGFGAGSVDGGRLVAALDQPALSAAWTALETLARQVAGLNDRNAQLTVQRQRNVRTALGILTGRPAGDDTYTRLRRRSGADAHHSLARA